MNIMERKMVDLLKDLKENSHVTGIKAEFEAEGTRIEEAMRLKEIISKVGLELTIKIGGCEAIKDMYEARSLGTCHLVGPMVETPYALKKYLGAVKLAFSAEELEEMEVLVNIETQTAVSNFEKMLQLPEVNELDGGSMPLVDVCSVAGCEAKANRPDDMR